MNPDSPSRDPNLDVQPRDDAASVPQRDYGTQQNAAANVIRTQIDSLFSQETADPNNPYQRTHAEHPQPQADQWQQYHTAWQQYYQKYYESYYTDAVSKITQHQVAPAKFAELPESPAEEVSKDEALHDLRQKLLNNVRSRATKIRRSRHFIPILASTAVVLVFLFIQYNAVLIGTVRAYVSPGSIDPQNIVVDPTANVPVGPDPRLIIPKINVDVPVVYGVGNDYNSQMAAMEKGVAHFAIPGASSVPGQIGNTALSGHSSNDLFDGGDYKFIFAQLEKLTTGDSIYANYEGKRYTYTVTKMEVVKPSEVGKLVYPTDKPVLTLITCTPLGTATNRLLVTAEQVSPDPTAAKAAPTDTSSTTDAGIPGAPAPTLFERLFGAR